MQTNYMNKKLIVIAGLAAFVVLGIAAAAAPEEKYKNLKVLPKNISEKEMDKVMAEFEHALGVGCDFCHAKSKIDTAALDFASDEKPEKLVTRKMISMSNKINKEWFNAKSKYGEEEAMLEARCMTCHHGEPHPHFDPPEE